MTTANNDNVKKCLRGVALVAGREVSAVARVIVAVVDGIRHSADVVASCTTERR